MVNVMGDALATGIMAHICRKDFVKEGEQVIHTHYNNFCPVIVFQVSQFKSTLMCCVVHLNAVSDKHTRKIEVK